MYNVSRPRGIMIKDYLPLYKWRKCSRCAWIVSNNLRINIAFLWPLVVRPMKVYVYYGKISWVIETTFMVHILFMSTDFDESSCLYSRKNYSLNCSTHVISHFVYLKIKIVSYITLADSIIVSFSLRCDFKFLFVWFCLVYLRVGLDWFNYV